MADVTDKSTWQSEIGQGHGAAICLHLLADTIYLLRERERERERERDGRMDGWMDEQTDELTETWVITESIR